MSSNAPTDMAGSAIDREVSAAPGLFRRMMRQKQAKIGAVLTGIVLLVALVGPLLLPWATGFTSTSFPGRPFQPDGVFGTDNLGRDITGGREGVNMHGLHRPFGRGLVAALMRALVAPILRITALLLAVLLTIFATLIPSTGLVVALVSHALTFGHFALRFGQHAGVMLGMLKKALLGHAIAGQLRISRQCQILVDDLLRRTAHLSFRAGAIKDPVDDIAKRPRIVAGLVARTGLGGSHRANVHGPAHKAPGCGWGRHPAARAGHFARRFAERSGNGVCG